MKCTWLFFVGQARVLIDGDAALGILIRRVRAVNGSVDAVGDRQVGAGVRLVGGRGAGVARLGAGQPVNAASDSPQT